MKKIIFLFTLLVFLSGCSIKNIDDYDINTVIDDALTNTEFTANVIFEGYKYYLPRGIKLIDKNGYNSKLLSNGNYYYLYVDVVSYYHKTNIEYSERNDLFYSKKISYDGKNGYIEIFEDNDIYFLRTFYNYARIEAYVSLENLNESIYDSIKILSSLTYNDTILSTIVGENILDYKEEEFSLFESQREEGNFLDYIEEYGVYKEENEDIKDEDFFDSES